jgi:hypothetical protein
VAAATSSTAGQAPITGPSKCETANASNPAPVSSRAVRGPSRRHHTVTQTSPQTASMLPPRGREPVTTATAKPAISPAAAIGAVTIRAVGSRSLKTSTATGR